MSAGSLERRTRPLTEAEAGRLERSARSVEQEGRRARMAAGRVGAVVFGLLWVATLLASDAPWTVVTGFWLLVGTVIVAWVRRDLGGSRSDAARWAGRLRAAAEHGTAEEIRIRADALVELEEFEDEGACWGFQVAPRRMVFVCGQEFYEDEDFPTLDLTIVHPLGPDGLPVDAWIEARGPKAAPARIVDAERKWTLAVPDHLDVVEASVATLEEDLGTEPR